MKTFFATSLKIVGWVFAQDAHRDRSLHMATLLFTENFSTVIEQEFYQFTYCMHRQSLKYSSRRTYGYLWLKITVVGEVG